MLVNENEREFFLVALFIWTKSRMNVINATLAPISKINSTVYFSFLMSRVKVSRINNKFLISVAFYTPI